MSHHIQSQPSYWIDSVQFKEMSNLTSKVNRIWFSNDGSKFFTWHEDRYFRIWDFKKGEVIEERFLNFDKVKDFDYSEENNLYSIAIGTDEYRGSWDIYTYIYNFNTDTLIHKIRLDNNKPSDFDYYNNKFVRFIEGNNQLFTVSDHRWETDREINDGWFDLWDINSRKQIFTNKNIRSTSICLNKTGDIIATSGYTSYWHYEDPQGDPTLAIRILNIEDLSIQSIGISGKGNDIPSNLNFSFDDKYLAYNTRRNGVCIHDLETNNIFKFIPNGFENENYVPHNILFSYDSYDFYTSSWVLQKNNDSTKNIYSIRKWNLKTDIPIDSINLNVNETWKLDISPDSKYLIGASNTGRIRYWDLSILKETPVEEKINSEVKIFPNPTYDYLYINGVSDNYGDISIYNSLGNLIMKEDIKYKIDISFLQSGFYYLMIKDKAFKFIKI